MKIKTWFVRFFKCSFVLRVGAVIFELDKVSMSNWIKFESLGMTSPTLKTNEHLKIQTNHVFIFILLTPT